MEVRTYDEIRDRIKCGDLFEFGSASLLGRAIRFFTKQEVNHSALGMSIDEYSNYSGNRKFLLEADPDGIVLNTCSRSIQECLDNGGVVYWSPLLPQYDSQRPFIADWALQQVGIKYDYGSLFKNAIARVNASVRKLFCSEFVFISLVTGRVLRQYRLDDSGAVTTLRGEPVKAPRPGEFRQFGCYGEPVRIVK